MAGAALQRYCLFHYCLFLSSCLLLVVHLLQKAPQTTKASGTPVNGEVNCSETLLTKEGSAVARQNQWPTKEQYHFCCSLTSTQKEGQKQSDSEKGTTPPPLPLLQKKTDNSAPVFPLSSPLHSLFLSFFSDRRDMANLAPILIRRSEKYIGKELLVVVVAQTSTAAAAASPRSQFSSSKSAAAVVNWQLPAPAALVIGDCPLSVSVW